MKSQARLAGFLLSVPVWMALAVTFFAGKPLDKALAEFQAEGDAIFAQ